MLAEYFDWGVCFFFVCLLVAFGSMPAYGQQVFGNILGTVTDPTGAGVPGAKVTITDQNKGTVTTVTTNESGNYSSFSIKFSRQ